MAGLALATIFFVIPEGHAGSLAKSMVVAVSLAIFAAVLISVARQFGA